MASHPKIRRAANLALFAYAPIIFAFYGFFVAVGRMSWLTMGWPLFIAAAGAVGRYATRDSLKAVERAPAAPRWELKAPNPAQGQCPVCGLTDLAERAVGDELLGDAGTALARVVAYGPDRAHAECAAVVPYVAPARSTSGGTRHSTPVKPTGQCAAVPLSDGHRMCLAHNQGDPRCGVYSPGGYVPEPPSYIARDGSYRARCAYCPWNLALKTEGAAELSIREHSRSCLKRAGVTVGKQPPEGWWRVGSLTVAAGPVETSEPLLQISLDIMSRRSDLRRGGLLLLTDASGRVAEGGEVRCAPYPAAGLLVALRVAGPLARAHACGAGVWVRPFAQQDAPVVAPPSPPKRGRLRDAFANAMAEEAAALGEKLQRELGLQPPSVQDRVAAQMDAHLTWAGSHSWEEWRAHGFETRVEAAAWYRLGFTPWRAQSWRQAGFTDPDAVARTGRTWPIELPGCE